jgi:oligopeptide transport system substrate-binding protein
VQIIHRFFLLFLPFLLFAKDVSKNEKQVFRINFLGGSPKSLHPHLCRDIYSMGLYKSLYEGLTRIKLDGKVELAIAKKIEISKCKTIYTIYLRQSKWANGEKLFAKHFIDAWKLAIKKNTRCVQPYRFFPIKNAEKIFTGKLPLDRLGISSPDNYKIIIHLEHPTPYFLQLLADPIFSPLFDTTEINENVFNGPFIVDEFNISEEINLKKNPLYWDFKNVKLNAIKISLIRDITTVYELYQKGKLDFIGSPYSGLSQEIINNANEIKSKKVCAPHWIYINTKNPILKSKKIRKALSLAVDRKYISKHILTDSVVNHTIIPQNISSLDSNFSIISKKKIRELFYEGLKEINLSINDFVITLSFSSSGNQDQLTAFLKYHWESFFNIKVNLEKLEWGTFYSKLCSRNYCIAGTTRYTTFEHPLSFLEFFYDKKNNYSNWENSKFQKYIDLANHTTSNKMLKKHLAEAEKVLEEECPVISLFVHKHLYLCDSRLKNFYPSRLVYTDFKWAYFE